MPVPHRMLFFGMLFASYYFGVLVCSLRSSKLNDNFLMRYIMANLDPSSITPSLTPARHDPAPAPTPVNPAENIQTPSSNSPTHAGIGQVSTPILRSDDNLLTIHQPLASQHVIIHQQEREILNSASVVIHGRALQDNVSPTALPALRENATIDQIKDYIGQWRLASSDPQVLNGRSSISEEILQWLSDSKKDKTLNLHKLFALPNIFHTKLVQDNLKKLVIAHQNTPVNVLELPELAGNLESVEELTLKGAGIEISDSIGHLSNLIKLNINCCKQTDLPETIGNLNHLTTLSIVSSELTHLPNSIGGLINLEYLRISHCLRLTTLPETFGNLKNLDTLKIVNANITHLPNSFGNLSQLRIMRIEESDKIKELPISFVNLTKLQTLSLSRCAGFIKLPDSSHDPLKSFGNLKNLNEIFLDGCEKLDHLPNSICRLPNLTKLALFYSGVKELPESLDELPALTTLTLPNTSAEFPDAPSVSWPIGVYRLALRAHVTGLPDPWPRHVQWMRDALAGTTNPCRITTDRYGQELIAVDIKRATAVPFAQEHLALFANALRKAAALDELFRRKIDINYIGEPAIDAGGLSKEYFFSILSNVPLQTAGSSNPLITDSGEGHCNMKSQSPMTLEHTELAKDVGTIIATVLLKNQDYQIGNVFQKNFYAGLLHLFQQYPNINDLPDVFEDLNEQEKKQLCFAMTSTSEASPFFGFQMLNMNDDYPPEPDREEMEKFSTLLDIINSDKDNITKATSTGIAEAVFSSREEFYKAISSSDQTVAKKVKSFINEFMLDSAFQDYAQVAVPLIPVANGVYSILFSLHETSAQTEFESFLHSLQGTLSERAEVFAARVQGAAFTPETFIQYMDNSIKNIINSEMSPPHPTLKRQLEWLQQWCHDPTTTPDQLRNLLKHVNGSPVIPGTHMKFFLKNNMAAHTCFNSLDLPESIGKIGETPPGATDEEIAAANQMGKETFIVALNFVINSGDAKGYNMA